MPIYKNISAKYIIAKLYRDLKLEDTNYELDCIEWIGEALDFIGAASQLERTEATLTITDYKAPLPDLFVSLNQLLYEDDNAGWIFLKYNPSSFNAHEESTNNFNANTRDTYSLNPNYIVTTIESGTIDISYNKIATDDDGYPLVPDNQYFREALFWYCFKQILLGGYQPKSSEMNYQFADLKWKFYCTAARNKANYPDIGQYQRFRDIWVGLIPQQRLFQQGYNLSNNDNPTLEVVTANNLITRPLTT